jgi:hypothetical protein
MASAFSSRTRAGAIPASDSETLEILTVRNGKIVEAEVYFGWTIPHEAGEGSFIAEQR